jgi:hydroxyacylglutathione hydrolase
MGNLQGQFKGLDATKNNQIFYFGDESIKVIHTPGHTLESACFLIGKHLFTGDTLFLGDVGRVDLV